MATLNEETLPLRSRPDGRSTDSTRKLSAMVEAADTADVGTGGLRCLEKRRLGDQDTTNRRTVDPAMKLRMTAGDIEDHEDDGEKHRCDRGGATPERTSPQSAQSLWHRCMQHGRR